jgi:hypothetical protein
MVAAAAVERARIGGLRGLEVGRFDGTNGPDSSQADEGQRTART